MQGWVYRSCRGNLCTGPRGRRGRLGELSSVTDVIVLLLLFDHHVAIFCSYITILCDCVRFLWHVHITSGTALQVALCSEIGISFTVPSFKAEVLQTKRVCATDLTARCHRRPLYPPQTKLETYRRPPLNGHSSSHRARLGDQVRSRQRRYRQLEVVERPPGVLGTSAKAARWFLFYKRVPKLRWR